MAENLIIAKTMSEAVALKNENSAFLAGGTEINRLGSFVQAKDLIGIGRISDLDGISVVEDATPKCHETGCCCKKGQVLRIGAMCTFQDIVESPLAPSYLKEACLFMASRTKRNMATIGGNVAMMRDDSYLYPTLLAAGAKLEMMNKDGEVFFKCTKHYLENAELYKDALICAVLLPAKEISVCSKRISNTAQSHAALTVSASCIDGKVRIGAAIKNTKLAFMKCLSEKLTEEDLDDKQILETINGCDSLVFKKDIYGSPEYKKYLLSVIICDLVRKAKGGRHEN